MKIINLLCILSVILLSACSSTGKSSKEYPPKFYEYSLAEQNLIRSGQIAVDFDENQVRMAWGNPSRIKTNPNSNRYYWEYHELEARQNVLRQVGNAIARGSSPTAIASQDPFHNKISKRIVFDAETRKVLSFSASY